MRAAYLVGIMLMAATAVGAQDSTGTVVGTIRDTAGTPLEQGQVSISGVRSARTDSSGRYVIAGVPPGTISVTVVRLDYERGTRLGVVVTAGATTRADVVLHLIPRPRPVYLPCPTGCVHTRQAGSLDDAPSGVGIIRDSATWAAVTRRFPERLPSHIDWQHEMVLLLSYGGGLAEMDEHWGFNRAQVRDSTLVVTLGPDSLIYPKSQGHLFEDRIIFPVAIAMPRSTLPVRYEKPAAAGWIPPIVDWRAMADTTPRSR